MRNTMPAPTEGSTFVDDEGTRWMVESITRSDNFPDFYLVHLRFWVTPESSEETRVLAPREFAALVREKRLVGSLRINVYPVKGYSITVNLPDRESGSGSRGELVRRRYQARHQSVGLGPLPSGWHC